MLGNGRPVEVESGRVAGVAAADATVTIFKGIPYAAPPVGALRWRPPQPPAAWSGIRPCVSYGPRSVQPSRPANSISYFGPEAESEDCLYLNVWTGAQSESEKRPVMVWFHGGAFFIGSGGLPLFNGEYLAAQGVVIVTVNYRLGRLGFLVHPELTQESDWGASGNYGMLDQIAALAWVERNISAFGGDPGCVTVFGQSAGAISACTLMASPLATGLFHRVIGQSGAAMGPVTTTSVTGNSLQSLEHAEHSGLEFASRLGESSIAGLRAKPAEEIQLAGHANADPSRSPRGAFDTSWLIVDGHVLPDAPYAIFARGEQNDVPLLTGTMSDEGATMPAARTRASYEAQTREEFGEKADALLALFPARDDREALDASRRAFSYRNFIWQNWTWATLHARTGRAGVHYYRFEHAPPIPPGLDFAENAGAKLGAFHCAEIPYVFRNLGVRDWPWRPEDTRMSDMISRYWVNFARTGDPNGAGLPAWPAFDPAGQATLTIADPPRVGPPPDAEALAFWDAHYAAQRAKA